MSVLNLPINNHGSSYRQTSVVLSQESRTLSDNVDQPVGKAPILSDYGFKLVCEDFLDLFGTSLSGASCGRTELSQYPTEADLPLL